MDAKSWKLDWSLITYCKIKWSSIGSIWFYLESGGGRDAEFPDKIYKMLLHVDLPPFSGKPNQEKNQYTRILIMNFPSNMQNSYPSKLQNNKILWMIFPYAAWFWDMPVACTPELLMSSSSNWLSKMKMFYDYQIFSPNSQEVILDDRVL